MSAAFVRRSRLRAGLCIAAGSLLPALMACSKAPPPPGAEQPVQRVRPLLAGPRVVKQAGQSPASEPPPSPAPPPPSESASGGGGAASVPRRHARRVASGGGVGGEPPSLGNLQPAPAPAPAPPPDPTEALLNTYQAALTRGFIEYNPPSQMTVGTPVTVLVRVHHDKLVGSSGGAAPGSGAGPAMPGKATSDSLNVYPQMRLTLGSNSGGAFAITPDPGIPATQVIPQTGYAEWRWQVSPLTAGPQQSLVVTAWADLSDLHLDPILIQEFEAEVTVEVAPSPPLSARIQTFVAKNWQWLWTALVVPAAGLLLAWWKRKKGGDKG